MPGISLSDRLLIHTEYRLPTKTDLAQTFVISSGHNGAGDPRATSRFVAAIAQKLASETQAHPTSLPCPTLRFGEHFSAADVLYGTTFAMFGQSPMLPNSAVLDAYVQRVVSRPAFARAQALVDGA